MMTKGKGLWRTDEKTGAIVKAVAGGVLAGLMAAEVVNEPLVGAVTAVLRALFG